MHQATPLNRQSVMAIVKSFYDGMDNDVKQDGLLWATIQTYKQDRPDSSAIQLSSCALSMTTMCSSRTSFYLLATGDVLEFLYVCLV
jgi:hypothetical protein